MNEVTGGLPRIVLMPSAMGLRESFGRIADALRERGLPVDTIDLYDGRVFDTLEEGLSHRDELGYAELARRASQVLEFDGPIVPLGFSLGCRYAQWLAMRHPGAVGCIDVSGAHRPGDVDANCEHTVPVAVHLMSGDSWVDPGEALHLLRCAGEGSLSLYTGGGHLFFDSDTADFSEAATVSLIGRIETFARERIGAS